MDGSQAYEIKKNGQNTHLGLIQVTARRVTLGHL
jgi:hypothetical protein